MRDPVMICSRGHLCLTALVLLVPLLAPCALAEVECRSAAPSQIPSENACRAIANQIALEAFRDRTLYTWGRHFRDTPTTRKLPHTWHLPPDTPADYGECVYTVDELKVYSNRGAEGRFSLMDVALQMRRIYRTCLPVEESERNPRIGYAL